MFSIHFKVYGSGEQTRSFQYVSDLVDGLIMLMNSNYSLPVNLGNPVEHTINGKIFWNNWNDYIKRVHLIFTIASYYFKLFTPNFWMFRICNDHKQSSPR